MSLISSVCVHLEQNGNQKNVSLAIDLVYSNQGKFCVKLYSAPESEANEPNFKCLCPFGAKW